VEEVLIRCGGTVWVGTGPYPHVTEVVRDSVQREWNEALARIVCHLLARGSALHLPWAVPHKTDTPMCVVAAAAVGLCNGTLAEPQMEQAIHFIAEDTRLTDVAGDLLDRLADSPLTERFCVSLLFRFAPEQSHQRARIVTSLRALLSKRRSGIEMSDLWGRLQLPASMLQVLSRGSS
jgi:hypothetical protein